MYTVPFVLQRHDAYKAGLHYDLRILYPNKKRLISFIFLGLVPSPVNQQKKVFVIRTFDHKTDLLNQDYLEIPKGEYGGGVIETIQKGTVEVYRWEEDILKLNFISESKKDKSNYLDGVYVFIKLGTKTKDNSEIWMVIQKQIEERLASNDRKYVSFTEQFENMSLIQGLAFRTALTNLSMGVPFSTVLMKLHEQTKIPITLLARLLAREAINQGIITPRVVGR